MITWLDLKQNWSTRDISFFLISKLPKKKYRGGNLNVYICCIAINIPITTVIQTHLQMQNTGEYKCRRTLLFRYKRFISFLTSVHRHEERDTILTMQTILSNPNKRAAHLAMLKISVGRDQQNSNFMPQR